jgi:hypothetical protein
MSEHLTIIPTTSERTNYTALAAAPYSYQHGTVVVLDQNRTNPLPGYTQGRTWIHTKNDNLLGQIDDGAKLAVGRGAEFITLLDDDIEYMCLLEERSGKYRIKSSKDALTDDWKREFMSESLAFIDNEVPALFEDDVSMLVISSRLFFPSAEVPYVSTYPLARFPSVFNDHVIWRTEDLLRVLEVFRELGRLNYSAGVDKAGAVVNNYLGNRVGRLQWVRATKTDITGNVDSTIYDFGDTEMEQRNLIRNMHDAESLRKLKPLLDGTDYHLKARITRNGTLNGFTRAGAMSLDEMVDDYLAAAELKLLL